MSTEITDVQLDYADPEDGRSRFWRNVSNYHLDYMHPEGDKRPEYGGNKLLRPGRNYLPIGRYRLDKGKKRLRNVGIYKLGCIDPKYKEASFYEMSVFNSWAAET
jgi:hypothetical protein